MGRRVLVTGGRAYGAVVKTFAVLDAYRSAFGIDELAHGACPIGLDNIADEWCKQREVKVHRYPADWSLGRSAGPRRNQEMFDDFKPDAAIVFPGGTGTASMRKIIVKGGIVPLTVNDLPYKGHPGI